MSYLFHKDVFLPKSVSAPCYEGRLHYGNHSLQASLSDRYGEMTLPEVFCAANAELIESESDGQRVTKQVWRQSLDDERDIILVLTPNGRVKTVWINLKSDQHRTLRRELYMRA